MKEILRKLAPIAGYPVFFVATFFIFFMWTFPFNKMKDRLEGAFAAQQRSTSTPQELKIDELSSYWITGVSATGVHLYTQSTEPGKAPTELKIDRIRGRLSVLGLLLFNKNISYRIDAFGGVIDGIFEDHGKVRNIDVNFDGVDVLQVPLITEQLGVPIEGKLYGSISFVLPEGRASKGNGKLNLELRDVAVGDGKAKLKGLLALPRMAIGNITIEGEAKDGILKISKVAAGGQDVELAGDGRIQMKELATDAGLDVNVKFKINDGYRKKSDATKSIFGEPGSKIPPLFEADSKVLKSKTQDGFYQFHVRGQLGRPDFQPAPTAIIGKSATP